jgi:hypothetical protein
MIFCIQKLLTARKWFLSPVVARRVTRKFWIAHCQTDTFGAFGMVSKLFRSAAVSLFSKLALPTVS